MVVYLVCTQRSQAREVLADLLWDDRSQRRALSNLRVVLTNLRKEFDPYFVITRDSVALNPESEIWSDVIEFEDCLAEIQRDGGISTATAAERAEKALNLYRGEFLEGFYVRDCRGFEEWMVTEQERLHHLAVGGLHDLVRYDLQTGAYQSGIAHATRLLSLDPLSEAAHRQMMRLLAYTGRRSEALDQYESFRQLLLEELDLEPSGATKVLVEKIHSGELVRSRPPQRIVRGYEVEEQIGSGSHGTVFSALQPSVGREVAIKIIQPQYANDPEFIRRFETEAQTIARLEHPHIVPLYDYWREPDGAYLVMRWVRGDSLEHLLSEGPLDQEIFRQVTSQVAEALHAAHQQGIVHRDLKPANILIDESGNAYLSDFGIAKQLSADGKHSLTGGLIGTPTYASPEQLRKQPVNPRSDIYSFGLLLYQMLTGEAPFQADSLADLIDKHLHEPLPPLSESRPDLPVQVDEVLHRATAKDPEARFADAMALWESLDAALSGTPSAEPVRRTPDKQARIDLHNPYKGLLAFQEADAEDFFGREALVERLLARLSGNGDKSSGNGRDSVNGRFLAVIGPSGSGKSSLVKAGLIPALRSGRIAGSENWFLVEMLPGTHPLEELEAALLRVAVNPPESLLSQLREDERGLTRAVKRVLPGGTETELVLIIDQFEETFTLVEGRDEARFFMDSLVAAVSDPRGRVRVVITLRADFYDRPLMIPAFSQLVQAGTEVVVPLTTEELVAAIQEPALSAGIRFEEGLIPRIVAEVNEQPGMLPLLQYSLTELFDRREGNLLTKQGYEQIGGVLGALSRRAEEIYQGLDEAEQAAARQIFLRLVTLGEGVEDTRRRVLHTELEDLYPALVPYPRFMKANSGKDTVDSLLQAFGEARLLSFDRDPATRGPTVEVAHEALLREWGRLRRWLAESREDLRLQRLLGQMARDWKASGEDASFLLRGSRLDLFENWQDETQIALTREELAFFQASLAEREARRAEEAARRAHQATLERRSRNFLRALIVVLALATAVSLYLTGFAFRQRDDARTAALAEAAARREASSRELVRFAEAELENPTDPSFSLELLLARQAVLTTWQADRIVLDEAERALRNAINLAPILSQELSGHAGRVNFAAWSPDGKRVVSAGADGIARIWEVETGDPALELRGHSSAINTAAWSPDGTRVLTASQDRSVRIWDARTGEVITNFPTEAAAVSAAWHPSGSRLLVAAGRTAQILEAGSGEPLLQVRSLTGDFNFAAWSPSGDRFATADNINNVQIWDAATGERLASLEANEGPVYSVQWSHDGNSLLSAHVGNLARIWDVETRNPLFDLEHDASVQFAAWNPEGSRVATVTADGRITLWDPLTGEIVRQWRSQQQILWSAAWSPDGAQVLTADEDGGARIWEAESLEARSNLPHKGPVLSVDWSPDGEHLITAVGLTLAANIWDLQSGSLVMQLAHPSSVSAVAWSPDGERVAAASLDTVYLWNAITGQRESQLPGGLGAIHALDWSHSGDRLVTGGQDRIARILDAGTGDVVQLLEGHTGQVFSAGWSPDEGRIVTGSSDQTGRVWDVQTGESLLTLAGHTDRVNVASFSPDGGTILTASSDRSARLWSARTGELLHVLEGHLSAVWSAAWSPDGALVATAGDDGAVLLWDPQTGEQTGEAAHHDGPVWSAAWSPEGGRIASAGQESTVRISTVGIEGLLAQAEGLIRREPPEFSPEERCLYLHECGN